MMVCYGDSIISITIIIISIIIIISTTIITIGHMGGVMSGKFRLEFAGSGAFLNADAR